MTPSDASLRIAVLDIGKTNLKLLVASEDGWPLETHMIPNAPNTAGPYLAYDLAGLEEWFLDTLAVVSKRHVIGAVIATAHGCGAVLVDGDTPVLPMMDYDAASPPAIDQAYARIAPPYGEVFCGIGAGAMRLAKQLLWQETAYPAEFARANAYLTTAQFFALRLGGRAASEISQLAAQSHIWDLVRHQPSSIMCERGWDRLLPHRAPAGAVLGTVSEDIARRTGLARSTEILCGVHDSNANLFRYKAAGMADASILSTGTWMIGFQRDLAPDKLDATSAMVLNIDVDSENVPSTLTMTGREYDLIRKENHAADTAVLAALPTLIAQGTLPLPSFIAEDGLFPGAAHHDDRALDIFIGRMLGHPEFANKIRAMVLPAYAALSSKIGASKGVVLDKSSLETLLRSVVLADLSQEASVTLWVHNWTKEAFSPPADYELDWSQLFDRGSRKVPDAWTNELVPQLDALRKQIMAAGAVRTIRLRGKCALSTGIALGATFPAVGSWTFEIPQPPAKESWRSDATPTPGYALQTEITEVDPNGTDLVLGLNIRGDGRTDVMRYIESSGQAPNAFVFMAPRARERNRLAAMAKPSLWRWPFGRSLASC